VIRPPAALVSAVAVCAIVACSASARAQGSYRSTPTGGRSALMGSTGIALARDGTAPFLNPSTIARIDDTSIAFSVNFYSFSSTRFTNFNQPGDVDRARFGSPDFPNTTLQQTHFDSLPSTLCLFLTLRGFGETEPKETPTSAPPGKRRGREKLAACLGNLERQELSVSAASYRGTSAGAHGAQAQSITRKWNRFHAGPTFSSYLTDDIAFSSTRPTPRAGRPRAPRTTTPGAPSRRRSTRPPTRTRSTSARSSASRTTWTATTRSV
jgi:hypothetical protein